jgi:hypothetical protein
MKLPSSLPFLAPRNFYERAAELMKLGIPLIPLAEQDKTPVTANAAKDATVSVEQIEAWAKDYPNSNVGAVAKDTFWFLDDDAGTLHTLVDIPATLKVKTSRGFHYYFRHDALSRAVRYGRGLNSGVIDIPGFKGEARCDNQYVVGFGSIHPSGAYYELLNEGTPIATAPAELLAWLQEAYRQSEENRGRSVKAAPAGPADIAKMGLHVGRPKISEEDKAAFKRLVEDVGFEPLVKFLNAHEDVRLQNPTMKVGETDYCPFPSHGPSNVKWGQTCFGPWKNEEGILKLKCLGCGWCGDVIQAMAELEGHATQYDAARAICASQGLDYNDYFPEPAPATPASNSEVAGAEGTSTNVGATLFVEPKEPFTNYHVAEDKPTGPEPWPEPKYFEAALKQVLPFELSFLPTSIQSWVGDVAYRTSVPLDFAGICALVCLAGCVNRRAFVYPKKNDKEWKEALALSGAVVASSGRMKTPTWKAFINILIELEMEWAQEFKEGEQAYEVALEASQVAGTAAPEEPAPQRRLVTNDMTPAKAQSIMSENPAGILFYRDELSSWARELDKEGNESARGLFLAAMNGNDPYTMDRMGRGTVIATMSASVFGGWQPPLMEDFLNTTLNISDGTVPRFGLAVYPDDIANDDVIDQKANTVSKEQFRVIVRKLAELEAESVSLHFSEDAQPIFMEWLGALRKKIKTEPDKAIKSHLSKYQGLLPKIAGLLQLVDLADMNRGQLMGSYPIDLEHLNRALRLLTYLESHARRIYGMVRDESQRAEESLAEHILKGDLKDGFTARDVIRKHWGHLRKEWVVNFAIETMEDMGWVRALANAKNAMGRPTYHYEINPALKTRAIKKAALSSEAEALDTRGRLSQILEGAKA